MKMSTSVIRRGVSALAVATLAVVTSVALGAAALAGVLALTSGPAFAESAAAQIDFGTAGKKKETGWAGAVTFGYSQRSGNSENSSVSGEFTWSYQTAGAWLYDGRFFALGKTESNVTTDERYAASAAAKWFKSDVSYIVGRGIFRKDNFAGVRQEYLGTAGYGRILFETDRHNLTGEVGGGVRNSEQQDGSSETNPIGYGGLKYALKLSENANFGQLLTIESGSDNTVFTSLSELRAGILGAIAGKASFEIRRNSDVSPGTDKTDYFTVVGLEYSF